MALAAPPFGPALACAGCGRAYPLRDGIYRFLLPERQQALAPFLDHYRRVRERDGYRSRPAEYYRALPNVAPEDPEAETWRVRAVTFAALVRRATRALGAEGARMNVLDLGAGNGWLCNRLSALGHTCAAVDWLDDADDGLGAARHYDRPFTLLQADYERLPLSPGQFDLVLYGGALHYSTDIEASLGHGLAMLRPGGALAILDSPTFRSRDSAEQMVARQAQRHRDAAGAPAAQRHGQGYLLAGELVEMGQRQGVPLRYWPSHGGWIWSLRRRWAGFKLRREPASFGLWLGIKRS